MPSWWKKSRKDVPATFNAHAETVVEKPMFRGAFKYRRALFPASGFYEWTGGKGARQPHLFTAADGSPVLAFAGLWDRWIDPDNFDEVISATIIVSDASAWMTPYHDRMPVLLEPQDFDAWLDGSPGPAGLKPAAEEKLQQHLVSPRLNRTGVADDDPPLSNLSHLSDGQQFLPIGRTARGEPLAAQLPRTRQSARSMAIADPPPEEVFAALLLRPRRPRERCAKTNCSNVPSPNLRRKRLSGLASSHSDPPESWTLPGLATPVLCRGHHGFCRLFGYSLGSGDHLCFYGCLDAMGKRLVLCLLDSTESCPLPGRK